MQLEDLRAFIGPHAEKYKYPGFSLIDGQRCSPVTVHICFRPLTLLL